MHVKIELEGTVSLGEIATWCTKTKTGRFVTGVSVGLVAYLINPTFWGIIVSAVGKGTHH